MTYAEEQLINELTNLASATDDDIGERIGRMRRIIGYAEEVIGGEVAAARVAGWSWAQLAPVLGTTRQAAHQRYA